MDRRELLAQLDRERREVAHDGLVIEPAPPVTRLHAADGSHFTVIHSALNTQSADEIISRETSHHRALGVAFEWKLYAHDSPADLQQRLASHSFTVGPHETVLVCGLSPPPAWMRDDTRTVVRLTDDEAVIEDFQRVAEKVFETDYSFTTGQLRDALRSGSTQHRGYVAYASNGEPVSIGRLYTHPQSVFGGLFGGGTLSPLRGRGFYRATVAARARDAILLGAKYLLIDALPTSRPIVERLGFVHLTDTWPCEWKP